jgi:hypothetical protein
MPGSHAGRGNRQDDKKSGAQKQDRQNMQAGDSKGKSSQSGEGRGWHGDSEGHSKAAKKGADK